MRLRSITLHGFKSFGNRTTLELSPRVSVIAGPNGSGKSNVVDALRWATGGGRASEFRAGEKTELIFHGASGKRSVGYAEVEVEVETPGGTVTVQRTLNRDGTGRLRLGGRAARFMDIDEALSGTGLGKGSLAIIGQGEISSVLLADPARLLAFVAEAAGVARLAGRFEQAEERLARAEEHMIRLTDLHDELIRHLTRLEEEAHEAHRHQELSRENLALQFTLAQLRRENLEAELARLAGQETTAQQSVAALTEDRAVLTEDLEERREQLNAEQEKYRQATAEVEAWKGEVRLAENRHEVVADRLRDIRRQSGALQQEINTLAGAMAPEQPEGSEEGLSAEVARQARQAGELRLRRPDLQAEVAATTAALQELETRARTHGHETARHQERLSAVQEQFDSVTGRLSGSEFETADSADEDSALVELQEEAARLTALQDELRQQLADVQAEHADAAAQARGLETALGRLRAAIEARSGFAQGPRLALGSGIKGVQGAVADLLEVDGSHRPALAAALGGRSEFVVVETAEQAQAVISFVRDNRAFVTVMPLDLIQGRSLQVDDRLLEAGGVIGLAIEQIRFEPQYARLFAQLLGSTLLMRDMDSAVRLARSHRDRPRLVTLNGEILDAGGAMSGGKRNTGAAVIGQAGELRQLESEARAAKEKQELVQQKLTELQQAVRDTRAGLDEALDSLAKANSAAAGRREQLAIREHLRAELQSLSGQLERDLADLAQVELPAAVAEEQLNAARTAAGQAASELAQLDEQLNRVVSAEHAASANLNLWQERMRSWQAARGRYEQDTARLTDMQQRSETLTGQAAELEIQLLHSDTALTALKASPPVDLSVLERGLEDARQQLRTASQRLDNTGTELAAEQEQLDRIRLTQARRETMLQAAIEEADRFPPGLERLEGTERNLRSRLQEVTQELETLGPVNHRAAVELEQERLRAHSLAADLLDAETAAAELRSSLAEVDAEVTSRNEAAIEAVKESFVQHARELFGGEAAASIETIREEGRPAGLAISLQPPGKRTTQLNLLSVGERTMGALAFLFALMDGAGNQGLPIAVLDEVDAPLDEANISRFSAFVERLATRGTQFLLISHQKTTFKVADTMWGITSDRGVSSVFSISRASEQPELNFEQGTT